MRHVQGVAFLAWGDLYVLAAAAGMVFLLAVVLVAARRRLKRRTQQVLSAAGDLQVAAGDLADTELADTELADTELADTELADTELADTELADTELADTEEVTDARVLHTQIRTLEEALEQEMARVREPAFTPEEIRDQTVAELYSRIRSTIRGLAARMEDDTSAAEVLARVEAAVDRLVNPTTSFVRPTLTIARQVAMVPTEVPSAALDPVRAVLVEDPAPGIAISEVPSTEMPHPQTPYAAPVLATPLDEEVVLPIPARTPSPETRRGRRWRRHSAA